MAFGNNTPTVAQVKVEAPKVPDAVNPASGRQETFRDFAHVVAGLTSRNEGIRNWVENTAIKDRTLDVTAFTLLAQQAQLHLTENGSLLFSYTMNGKVYNHQLTDRERLELSNILASSGDVSTRQLVNNVSHLFSGISLSQNMNERFDQELNQLREQNQSNTMHR